MKAIIKFVQEARIELTKVNWPTRKTVINLSLTVIGVSLVFAVLIASIDYVFTQGIKWLITMAPAPSNITAEPMDINLDDIEAETSEGNIQIETE